MAEQRLTKVQVSTNTPALMNARKLAKLSATTISSLKLETVSSMLEHAKSRIKEPQFQRYLRSINPITRLLESTNSVIIQLLKLGL
jgi:hypothetical protein